MKRNLRNRVKDRPTRIGNNLALAGRDGRPERIEIAGHENAVIGGVSIAGVGSVAGGVHRSEAVGIEVGIRNLLGDGAQIEKGAGVAVEGVAEKTGAAVQNGVG